MGELHGGAHVTHRAAPCEAPRELLHPWGDDNLEGAPTYYAR
jgi:hypothetical protein